MCYKSSAIHHTSCSNTGRTVNRHSTPYAHSELLRQSLHELHKNSVFREAFRLPVAIRQTSTCSVNCTQFCFSASLLRMSVSLDPSSYAGTPAVAYDGEYGGRRLQGRHIVLSRKSDLDSWGLWDISRDPDWESLYLKNTDNSYKTSNIPIT